LQHLTLLCKSQNVEQLHRLVHEGLEALWAS